MNFSTKNHELRKTNRIDVSKALNFFLWGNVRRTKGIITTVILIFITISATAQQGINYKALIKDGSGNAIASQSITVQFQILQGAGMTNVYQETHTPTTDANGMVIVNIGEGTTSDIFIDIDWASDDHYLNVQINTGGGLTDMGTTQFMAVPYALSAANAASTIDELSDGKSDPNGSSLFLGINAGGNDDGSNNSNVGIGFNALSANTTGNNNTANGIAALYANTTGYENTANGSQALFSNTTGYENTATGNEALYNNTTGSYNTANGFQALYSNTTGGWNTANGRHALWNNTTGEENTVNGSYALYHNTTGEENTANGSNALYFNTTGNKNTAIGFEALLKNVGGIRNTASGYQAMYSNTSGNYNTGIGYKTLYNQTTGHWNTALGRNALLNLTSGNNIGIGYDAQPSSATVSNEVIIGNSNNNKYRIWTGGWVYASDRKLKHAIQNIPVGLDLVLKLRPVAFIYNNANNEEKTFGFIAQEVKEAVKQSNLDDDILVSPLNEQYLGLRTTELISVLTKAIQEQQEIIEEQKTK